MHSRLRFVRKGIPAALVCLVPMSCRLDDEPSGSSAPNRVSFSVDGQAVSVQEGVSFAFIDRTKEFSGPNGYLVFEASTLPEAKWRVAGDRLKINIPSGVGPGTYSVRFGSLPSKNHVWVSYSKTGGERWQAYHGLVTLDEVGGVGGRLRLRFEQLELGNGCGNSRVLRDGSIDVRIGSEDEFPVTALDTGEGSEWAELGATRLLENNAILQLDETIYACDFSQYLQESVEGSVLAILSICGCDFDETRHSFRSQLAFSAYLPSTGRGTVSAARAAYPVFVLRDLASTPLDLSDDEMWYPLSEPSYNYAEVGIYPGDAVDIALIEPITFAQVVSSGEELSLDTSKTMQLTFGHWYGLIDSD